MVSDGGERVATELEGLLSGEGGELLNELQSFIRTHLKLWATVFFAGLLIGYPLAGTVLSWLLEDSGLLPEEASVVILQPLEVVILLLRLSAHFALSLVVLTIVLQTALRAAKSEEVRARLQGVDLSSFSSLTSVVLTLICSIGLAFAGIWYAMDFLLPLLFEYLEDDAASVGATTTWQLSAWVGFVASLSFGAAIGFQVPLLTFLLLRGEVVQRDDLIHFRRHICFAGFCAGSFLSPPDPLSMFLVAAPILILFEAALLLDRLFSK